MAAPQLDNVEDVYPLSPMQEGMLYHTIAGPGTGVFVDQICMDLSGELDVEALRAAWKRLVERHATLRTAFLWDGLDQPLQVVRAQVEPNWTEETGDDDRIRKWLDRDRRRGFDLASAPLFRCHLVTTGPDSWRFIWTFHHLVADGWSAQVLLDELLIIYESIRTGHDTQLDEPLRYRDFIAWHAAGDQQKAEDFWRTRLDGFATPHRLEIPGTISRDAHEGHSSHAVVLDEATTTALRDAAAHHRVTLNTLVSGAWALLLARWMRERDIVFGVTMSGRPAGLQGVERAVGLFINTLPVRVDVDEHQTIGDWLRSMQQHQVEMRDVEYSPLAAVQRWSSVPAGESLFESIFVFENYPPSERAAGVSGLEVRGMEFIEQSNYPLAVLVLPGQELGVTLVFDQTRFDETEVAAITRQLETILRQFGDPAGRARSLHDIETCSDDDVCRIREWEYTNTEESPSDTGILDIIAEVARCSPNAIAVRYEDRTMTYADLDAAANRVAKRLVDAGVPDNRLVGLYVERSIEMVAGILGILKAGAAYVPA